MGRGTGKFEISPRRATESLSGDRPRGGNRRNQKSTKREKTPEQIERLKKAEQQIKRLGTTIREMSPDDYEGWLLSLPRLYSYSLRNYALISWAAKHQGFSPTRVASVKEWNKQGRRVKKGESGLPVMVPFKINSPQTDSEGKPIFDENGNPKQETFTLFKPRFGVFDISQTEPSDPEKGAADLPERSQGATNCSRDLVQVAEGLGISVHLGGIDKPDKAIEADLNRHLLTNPNAGGFFCETQTDPRRSFIVTRQGLSPEEEARVIAHELGHAVLHSQELTELSDSSTNRDKEELEAEAVAFVLASDYGIATEFSAAYIKTWTEGASTNDEKKKATKRLNDSSERIRNAVKLIYERIPELGAEEEKTSQSQF